MSGGPLGPGTDGRRPRPAIWCSTPASRSSGTSPRTSPPRRDASWRLVSRSTCPSFFAAECGNTLWKKSGQRRELDRGRGREIFDEILAYPKRVHDAETLTALAYDLAHDIGNAKLAIYDFIYLALAVALDCRLVTADRVFYNALEASPHGPRLLWVADPIPD